MGVVFEMLSETYRLSAFTKLAQLPPFVAQVYKPRTDVGSAFKKQIHGVFTDTSVK